MRGGGEENIYFFSEEKKCPIENINRVNNNTGGMHVFTEKDINNNIRSSRLTDKKIVGKMNKLDNLKIDYFDIMLVDIEGCEYEFLLGAKEKICKYKLQKNLKNGKQHTTNNLLNRLSNIYTWLKIFGKPCHCAQG